MKVILEELKAELEARMKMFENTALEIGYNRGLKEAVGLVESLIDNTKTSYRCLDCGQILDGLTCMEHDADHTIRKDGKTE